MKTKRYLSSLAISKSIYGYPFNYIINFAVVVPLVLYLDDIGVAEWLNAIIISIPFVIMALIKNYTFFWLEDRYLIKFKAKEILHKVKEYLR